MRVEESIRTNNLPNPIQLLGVKVHPVNWKILTSYLNQQIDKREKCEISYVNIHCMNLTFKDREYRDTLNKIKMVYCDGYGVMLGAKILGYNIPKRMTGADWIYELMSLCERSGYSIYFLAGVRGVTEASAEKLKAMYPGVSIVGTGHGFFDKSCSEKVIKDINQSKPDILLLGLGSPLQEKWMIRHRKKIDAPVCWAMGGALDFVSGKVKRGPKWMTDNGLEWAFRLFIEPKRLWARYLVGNPLFMFHVLKERITKGKQK